MVVKLLLFKPWLIFEARVAALTFSKQMYHYKSVKTPTYSFAVCFNYYILMLGQIVNIKFEASFRKAS